MNEDLNEKIIRSDLYSYFSECYGSVYEVDKEYFVDEFTKLFKKAHLDIYGEYNIESYAEEFIDDLMEEAEEEKNNIYY